MSVQKRTSENVLLHTALENFYGAAEEMGLDDGVINYLAYPERALRVSIPVQMDDGTTKVFQGYRVQHSTVCGPAKGGLRYHPDVNMEECEALAMLMTWKCSLAGIPYGGGKGGISVDPFELSQHEREMMTRTFGARISPIIGTWSDVPAPDVNTNGQDMVWIMDTISKLRGQLVPGVITGKPISYWGSKGRNAATGLGVATCVLELLKKENVEPKDATVIVQGFGNVGSFNAKFLKEAGCKIVGISDITGGYYNPNGIDIAAATAHVESHPKRNLDGYTEPGLVHMSGEEILEQDCLVLTPCALEGVISEKNADKLKCKYIVEGANGPTRPEADVILDKNGVIVVPDFLANSGGVIGSYFEWVQDVAGYFWTEEEYNSRLVPIMKDNFRKVWEYAEEHNVKMRRAAFLVAIKRVADELKVKGFFL